MKLLIVESPGKVATLKKYLGSDWEVSASAGHIRDLPLKDIGVKAPDFRPTYELTERGKPRVASLKSLADRADTVYLATDPDREGEAISWHLKEALHLKNPKRVTFQSITPKAVLDAVSNPRTIDVHMVAAQEARRVLDRLVGYMVSGPMSRAMGQVGLSAGRVQSPAVMLVVDREEAIKAFKPMQHYGVRLHFSDGWHGDWAVRKLLPKEQEIWTDKAFALEVAKVRDVSVEDFKESETLRAPPAPFTTSTMQRAASAALNFDPDVTMKAAQTLYEKGHITYMRTDSPNLSEEGLALLLAYLKSKGLPLAKSPRTWKAKDGAQEGHEAIRPTHFEVEVAGDSDDEKKLYVLIRQRALASQMADARYATRTALMVALAPVQGKTVHFEAKGSTLVYPGWMQLTAKDATEEDEAKDGEPSNPIPDLKAGQALRAEKAELLEKVTKAPPRYTQASLIAELEAKGIGRPATYAAIMTNIIKNKGYIVQKGKQLQPTETGYLVVRALKGHFEFMDLAFTKRMEESLDEIAHARMRYLHVVSEVHEKLERDIAKMAATVVAPPPAHPCELCGKAMMRRKGKNGFFWGCMGYPDCKNTLPDVRGKPGKKGEEAPKAKPASKSTRTSRPSTGSKPSAAASSGYKCVACGKPLVHRVKEGSYDFWGCSGYPACKKSYRDEGGKPKLV